MQEAHDERRARLLRQFSEASSRFVARLEAAGAEAERPRENGWNVAQIAWHVAAVNEAFAGLMSGRLPGAEPAPDDFVERPWPEVVAGFPGRMEARGPYVPPPSVTLVEALQRLRSSTDEVRAAIGALTPERGSLVVQRPLTGRISIYQIGEWAAAHVIRHNAQAKAVLGR
jgi:hypothetical protein